MDIYSLKFLYHRAKDLLEGIIFAKVPTEEGVTIILNSIDKKDSLSVMSLVYKEL